MAQTQQEHAKQVMQLQHTLKHEANRSGKLETQTAELQEALTAKKAAQHAADSFSQQLKKLQQELSQEQQATRQAESTAHDAQTALQDSQAAISKLQASKVALQAALDQTNQKLKEFKAEVQAQQRLLQEAANADEAAQGKIAKLEVAILAAEHGHAVSSAATQRRDESTSASQASLHSDHSKLQAAHESTLTELEMARTRLVHVSQRCSDLQQALDAKQSSLDTATITLAAKEGETVILTAAIDTLEAEIQRLRQLQPEQDRRFAAASTRLSELENDLQSMQTGMEAETHDHANSSEQQQQVTAKLQAELKTCQEANDSLQAAHGVIEGRLTGVRAELAEKAALLDQAGLEIEELQQANTGLTIELKSSQVSQSPRTAGQDTNLLLLPQQDNRQADIALSPAVFRKAESSASGSALPVGLNN